MNDAELTEIPENSNGLRQLLGRTNVTVPKVRIKAESRTTTIAPRDPNRAENLPLAGFAEHQSVKRDCINDC